MKLDKCCGSILFFEGKNNIIGEKEQCVFPFNHFILCKDEQKTIKLSSTVPDIKFYETIRYNAKVKIDYVNHKGCIYTDSRSIGHIEVLHLMIFKLPSIQHLSYELSGTAVARSKNIG